MTKEIQSPNVEGRSGARSPDSSFGFRYSFGFRHSSSGFGNWFMESPLSLFRMHRDHEPSGRSEFRLQPVRATRIPPKGGTPNQPRFMESPHGVSSCIGTMNPAATTTGARTSVRLNAACGINSALLEAVRFRESPHGSAPVHWDHEPVVE